MGFTPLHDAIRQGFELVNRVVRPTIRSGVGNPPPVGIGPVVVGTVGAESGELREVPLLAARVGRAVLVSTVRDRSQWMANLRHEPHAQMQLFGQSRRARARVVNLPGLHLAVLRLDAAALEACAA